VFGAGSPYGSKTGIRISASQWRKQVEVAVSANDVSFEQKTCSLQGGNTLICVLPVAAIPVLVTDDL